MYGGCADPLLSLSLVSSLSTWYYQWMFCISSCVALVVLSVVSEKMRQSDRSYHAMRVYDCFQTLIHSVSLRKTSVIRNWCANMKLDLSTNTVFSDEEQVQGTHTLSPASGKGLWRMMLFCTLMFVLVVACSIPAALFVLSRSALFCCFFCFTDQCLWHWCSNVPADSNTFLLIFGNSLTAALVHTLFNKLLVPRAAAKLTRIKYGISDTSMIDPGLAIQIFRTQVGICLLVEVVTVAVAPATTMVIFDVSLRCCSPFTCELLELLSLCIHTGGLLEILHQIHRKHPNCNGGVESGKLATLNTLLATLSEIPSNAS